MGSIEGLTLRAMLALLSCRGLSVVWLVGLAVWSLAERAAAEPLRVNDVPNPRQGHGGWVSDPSGALGASAAEVERLLEALHRETSAEVAVAIVPSIGEAVPKHFATALFAYWGIGRKGHDDGALVLHVLDQRRVEIETGYGLEGALPDVKCAWLLGEVALPRFRDGALGAGHEALARGLAHGIRHPEATREQLVSAAQAGSAPVAAPAHVIERPVDGPPPVDLSKFAVELSVTGALASVALAVRRRAHRAFYRDEKRRPGGPWVGWLVGVLGALALLMGAAIADVPQLVHGSTAMLGLVAGLLGLGTWRTSRAARQRYAPRACGACGKPMTLLNDAKDDTFLEAGQQVEERLRSFDYDVWRCACGGQLAERYDDEGSARKCPRCSYQTEQCKRRVVLKPATESSSGLAESHHQCAHCGAQRTEQEVLPRIQRSSSSSGGSSSRGSSFGGGRSGGGGAGGSY
jgi:uncharacterized protein